ncbi:MAG: hypothetical protein KF833_16300 [Verrucomicrobiae bacterium]|nr:hypothetical protein [Verrucomicrobiae bacterium]
MSRAVGQAGEAGPAEGEWGRRREAGMAFGLHAIAWGAFYLTVVVAWGQHNAWPSELIVSVLSVPLSGLVAASVFAGERFGLAIEPAKGQQEQLIAALVLALGLASGHLVLMSLGWVCLGMAWLRPARPGLNWTEWLKVPAIFMTALPFWLDFEGHGWLAAAGFEDPLRNPGLTLPLALTTTQARVLGYCALLGMALFVRGRAFWLGVGLLPGFLVATVAVPGWIPGWADWPGTVRAMIPWGLAMGGIGLLANRAEWIGAKSRRWISGATVRGWFEGRRYSPWLAVAVVSAMQGVPLESTRFDLGEVLGLMGMGIMAMLLLGLRRRTPKGPVHSRSVAMVAGGVAMMLGAEFTTYEPLRRVALAWVILGLVSWRCFWPWRVLGVAVAASFVLLAFPAGSGWGRIGPEPLLAVRLSVAVLLLAGLARFARQPPPLSGQRGYSDLGWVPSKRFALILLGLMMLFQTASAFWPEHEMAVLVVAPRDEDAVGGLKGPLTPQDAGVHRLSSWQGPVQVSLAYPRKSSYLLTSPEVALRRAGWRVTGRGWVEHPHGEAMVVRLERSGGEQATAMWWFEQGERAFSHARHARRILWSGWHLADRRLRLVRLESTAVRDPEDLVAVARREGWFQGGRWEGGKAGDRG